MHIPYTSVAIGNLRPGALWELQDEDYDTLVWNDKIQSPPTKEEVETEALRLVAEWENTEYQRIRKQEYPPLADLADALYWQSQGDESKMTAYLAAVEAVKTKYPKGAE